MEKNATNMNFTTNKLKTQRSSWQIGNSNSRMPRPQYSQICFRAIPYHHNKEDTAKPNKPKAKCNLRHTKMHVTRKYYGLTFFYHDVTSVLRQLLVVSTIARFGAVPGLWVRPDLVDGWTLLWGRRWDWCDALSVVAATKLWNTATET